MALAAIIGVILHLILPDKEASYGQRSNKTEFELEVVGEESTTSETVMTKEQTTTI